MDQVKIGQFIQKTRKEKGFTQKQLADLIGMSDKTISKWETGNGLPELSVLKPLCDALSINVNELLSGEKLPLHEYSEKAEANMMELLKENEKQRKTKWWQKLLGWMLLLITAYLMLQWGYGGVPYILVNFIDLPSLILLAGLCLALVLLSGAKGKKEIIQVLRRMLPPAALFITLCTLVIVLCRMTDISSLGSNLAVVILCPLYATIAYMALTIWQLKMG